MQIIINSNPEPETSGHLFWTPPWNFYWIENPDWNDKAPSVCAFRRVLNLENDCTIRIHVSGDQRYTLFLDGTRIGFGPERGTHADWFFQTHDLTLEKGKHTLAATVFWTPNRNALQHVGHASLRQGLAVYAPGEKPELLNTGIAAWEVLPMTGYSFHAPVTEGAYSCVGARTDIDAGLLQKGVEAGLDSAGQWRPAAAGPHAMTNLWGPCESDISRMLKHGTLPPMYEKTIQAGKVRHAEFLKPGELQTDKPFDAKDSDPVLAESFQKIINGEASAVLPAGSNARILVDAENYVCAWPELTICGKGAKVKIEWAESLFMRPSQPCSGKANRDEIEGKFFTGIGDSFIAGGDSRTLEPIWWDAGRYILITVEVKSEPLEIKSLKLRETHYPHKFESRFSSDDSRWNDVFRISKRALEMCSHETYFDCPYYEQLMYGGDTRLEILATYAMTRDSRLPEKAMYMFDRSRDMEGLTRSRTPAIDVQSIPPFSLWWIMMVSDYSFWRRDPEFVRARMPGVRAVLEAFRRNIGNDGLLRALNGWNFTDWVGGWDNGMPLSAGRGVNATLNLQLAMVLRAAAGLEDLFGEKHLAARNRETADIISAAAFKTFWVPERNMYAEDAQKNHFTEHAQCMAILGGGAKDAPLPSLSNSAEDVDKTTIYFSHYLFEAYRVLGRPDAIYERLKLWFGLSAAGMSTTPETPEPTRSDCHAWGTHPMFHAFATFAGIRPASAGFRSVEIRPQFGPLKKISAEIVHPDGVVKFDAVLDASGKCSGTASVPEGIAAHLVLPSGAAKSWTGGSVSF